MSIRSITPIALDLPFEVGGPKSQFAGRLRQMAMLLGDAIAVSDGRMAVPTGPGLGRDPDAAMIAR